MEITSKLLYFIKGSGLRHHISLLALSLGVLVLGVSNIQQTTQETVSPTQQAPTQQAPTQQAPTQQAPTQQAPTQQAPTQQAPTQRTWTDRSGKFSTQAELIRLDGEMVELRKTDGTLVKLALERLSDADQEFLRAQTAQQTPKKEASETFSLTRIRATEQKMLYAKKIAQAYQDLLAQPGISESDRIAAERRLAALAPEVARDSLMVGKDFRLLEEVLAWRKESDEAIDELVDGPAGKEGGVLPKN